MHPQSSHSPYQRAFDLGIWAMVILVPLVFVRETVFIAYYPKLLLFHITLGYLYLVWLLRLRKQPSFRASPFLLPVALYIAVTVPSTFQAVNRIEAVVQLTHRIALVLLFLVLLNNLRSHDLLGLLRPIVGTGIIIALIGICQYAGWGLLWIPSAGMPSATLGYQNYAAMVMLLCIPIGGLLFLASRDRLETWLWGIGTGLLLTFLICTRTRGAWVGLLGALILTGLTVFHLNRTGRIPRWQGGSHGPAAAAGLLGVILFAGLVPPNLGGIGYDTHSPEKVGLARSVTSVFEKKSDKHRLDLWQNTLGMIADHPVLGVGLGNWQYRYHAYESGNVIWKGSTPRRPHNDYLWTAAELGVPGLLLFLWLMGLVGFRSFKLARSATTRTEFWFPVCLSTALLAILGHAGFSFPRERVTPTLLTWMLIAFIAILDTEKNRPPQQCRTAAWRAVPGIGIVLLMSCTLLSARGTAFDRHFMRTLVFIEQQAWENAVREATATMRYGLFDPQILLMRGVAHLALQQYDQAVKDNQQCLIYHPNLVNALNNLGMAYNGLQQYDRAIWVLQRIFQIDPEHIEGHANLGLAYKGQKRFDTAISEFEQALARKPQHTETRYQLAVVHEQLGQLEQAADHYGQILSDNPKDARAHYRMGVVRQRQQQFEQAVQHLQQALRLTPQYGPAFYNLGEIYAHQGDIVRARAAYETFLKTWQGDSGAARVVREKLDALTP